jgi:hypothetical protein
VEEGGEHPRTPYVAASARDRLGLPLNDEKIGPQCAIDKLDGKYQAGIVAPASQRGLSLQYLGAKIAFTRLPDPVEFRE